MSVISVTQVLESLKDAFLNLLAKQMYVAGRLDPNIIPPFTKKGKSWDEEEVLSYITNFQFGKYLMLWYQSATPTGSTNRDKKTIQRMVIHHTEPGATLLVVINDKFIVNLSQYRFAIRAHIEEVLRSFVPATSEVASEIEIAKTVLFGNNDPAFPAKLPKLAQLKPTGFKVTSLGESYMQTSFMYDKEPVYLVQVTLDTFTGTASELQELLNTPDSPRRVKIRMLEDVLSFKFVYHDSQSKDAIYSLLCSKIYAKE